MCVWWIATSPTLGVHENYTLFYTQYSIQQCNNLCSSPLPVIWLFISIELFWKGQECVNKILGKNITPVLHINVPISYGIKTVKSDIS